MSCDIQSIVENALSKQVNDLGKPLVDGQVILDKKFFGLFNDDISRRLKAEHQIDSDENVFNVTEATSLASRPDTYGYAKNYYYTRWTLNAPLVAKLEANRRNPPAPSLEELGIKPGVPELFDSNPELANAVYEALGLINTSEIQLDKPRFNPDNAEAISYPIKINDKYAGVISLDKDGYISSSIGMAGIELEKEFQGKGYGTKVYIALAEQLAKEGKTLKSEAFGKTDINESANRVWKSLLDKGYAVDKGSYFEVQLKDKQQAQQLYSQYLDTIFPDSLRKAIYGHSGEITKDDVFDRDKISGYSTFDGFYFYSLNSATKINTRLDLVKHDLKRILMELPDYVSKEQNKDLFIKFFNEEVGKLTDQKTKDFFKNRLNSALENLKNDSLFETTKGTTIGGWSGYGGKNDISEDVFVVLNIKNPYFSNKNNIKLEPFFKEGSSTSILPAPFDSSPQDEGFEDFGDNVMVKNPEQIHILGNKQDIEGFKSFVTSEEAQEEYFDSKQREEQLSDYYMGDTALMEQEVKDLERFRDENSNMPDEDIDDYFTSCK